MDSTYKAGRGRSWLKVKYEQRQEFVIGGFTEPTGSRAGFGALLIGHYENGQFTLCRQGRHRFYREPAEKLYRMLGELEQPHPPFANADRVRGERRALGHSEAGR